MIRNVLVMWWSRWHVRWNGWVRPNTKHQIEFIGMPGVSVAYRCSCGRYFS